MLRWKPLLLLCFCASLRGLAAQDTGTESEIVCSKTMRSDQSKLMNFDRKVLWKTYSRKGGKLQLLDGSTSTTSIFATNSTIDLLELTEDSSLDNLFVEGSYLANLVSMKHSSVTCLDFNNFETDNVLLKENAKIEQLTIEPASMMGHLKQEKNSRIGKILLQDISSIDKIELEEDSSLGKRCVSGCLYSKKPSLILRNGARVAQLTMRPNSTSTGIRMEGTGIFRPSMGSTVLNNASIGGNGILLWSSSIYKLIVDNFSYVSYLELNPGSSVASLTFENHSKFRIVAVHAHSFISKFSMSDGCFGFGLWVEKNSKVDWINVENNSEILDIDLASSSKVQQLLIQKSSKVVDTIELSQNITMNSLIVGTNSSVSFISITENSRISELKIVDNSLSSSILIIDSSSVDEVTVARNSSADLIRVRRNSTVNQLTVENNSKAHHIYINSKVARLIVRNHSEVQRLMLVNGARIDSLILENNAKISAISVGVNSSIGTLTLTENSMVNELILYEHSKIDLTTVATKSGIGFYSVDNDWNIGKIFRKDGVEQLFINGLPMTH